VVKIEILAHCLSPYWNIYTQNPFYLGHSKMIETNLIKIWRRIVEMWQFQEWFT
jgi:hypothetical protein